MKNVFRLFLITSSVVANACTREIVENVNCSLTKAQNPNGPVCNESGYRFPLFLARNRSHFHDELLDKFVGTGY